MATHAISQKPILQHNGVRENPAHDTPEPNLLAGGAVVCRRPGTVVNKLQPAPQRNTQWHGAPPRVATASGESTMGP